MAWQLLQSRSGRNLGNRYQVQRCDLRGFLRSTKAQGEMTRPYRRVLHSWCFQSFQLSAPGNYGAFCHAAPCLAVYVGLFPTAHWACGDSAIFRRRMDVVIQGGLGGKLMRPSHEVIGWFEIAENLNHTCHGQIPYTYFEVRHVQYL